MAHDGKQHEHWHTARIDRGPFKYPLFIVRRYDTELNRWQFTYTPSGRPRQFRYERRAEAFAEKMNA